MQQNKKQKSLIYVGLSVLIAWFTSQGCFPIIYPKTPDPCASSIPTPSGASASSAAPCPVSSPIP